jgi:FtsZ-binding cell division protein ZapB
VLPMSLKDFDKLEEKISRLLNSLKTLRDENQKMKKELQSIKQDSSQRDGEKNEIKKKITALIELIDSIEK